ncbi:MAG: nucleoside triphosphate pyrophosphatase [Bdellovibrionales bacterium]
MHQLILASQSPRRFELLQKAGFRFTVDTVKVSEIIDKNLNLEAAIERVAWDKAQALVQARKFLKGHGFLILSADTVVALGEMVLGKPKDPTEAERFLRSLAGAEHRVITAICVYEIDTDAVWTAHDTTWVQFHPLTDQQIHDYVRSGEPLDRAGAYAIQGGAATFVKARRGSWSNVVGLPMELFERMVKQHGWQLARN